MRVLLPPSEAKTGGGRGRPLDRRPDTAADPLLVAPRRRVRAALQRLLGGDRDEAARALLLPPGVADDALERNSAAGSSATTPALRRYAGVVYDGLGYASVPPEVQRTARRDLLIFSGLFGLVRGDEPIPDYRLPAKAVLPGVGVAGTFWRPHLDSVLSGPAGTRLLGRGLIIDLRSGDYAAMWRPCAALRERVVGVRILSPRPRGGYGVVSYNSKFAKGQLAAGLLRAATDGDEPRGRDDVARIWLDSGGHDARPSPVGLDLYTS